MNDDPDRRSRRILLEERRYPPPEDFAAQANAQPDIYDRDFEEFWEREGRERVTWFEPFDELYEWEQPYAKWYLGGKLNVTYNCVDRHVEAGNGEKVAYYWEGEPEDERRDDHVRRPPARGRALRERAQEARREEGHAGRHLHGHGPGAAGGDARLRAASAPRTRSSSAASRPTRSPDRLNDMECEVLITQDEGLAERRARCR